MDCKIRAAKVKMLIFDVDGVLTDGKIAIGPDGELMKEFFARDGMGIALAQKAGIRTAVITGRQSDMVRVRSAELRIGDVYQGSMDKVIALYELMEKYQLQLDEVGYVGDDLNDLPVMTRIGLACAVGDAAAEVKERAHFIAGYPGGRGAVRQVVELILKAQGKWDEIIVSYCEQGLSDIRQ